MTTLDKNPRGFRIRIEYPGQLLYRYGSFDGDGWYTTSRKKALVFDEVEKALEGVKHLSRVFEEAGAVVPVSIEEVASFDPDWCTPPGGTIRESLEHVNLTKEELRAKLGLSSEEMDRFLQGEVPIDDPLSQQLAQILGGTPAYWRALDSNYREGLRKGLTVVG